MHQPVLSVELNSRMAEPLVWCVGMTGGILGLLGDNKRAEKKGAVRKTVCDMGPFIAPWPCGGPEQTTGSELRNPALSYTHIYLPYGWLSPSISLALC